jgi:hypothetical protein
VGLLTGVGFALAAAYERLGDGPPATPVQAIPDLLRTARLGALVGPLVLCPVLAAVATLAIRLTTGQASPQAAAMIVLFAAPPVALLTSLRQGGAAYLRHQAVLWLLAREDLAPHDLLGFLAHAARLNLLRRRLDGYEFVHPLVRQHLAERPVENGSR